MFKKVGLLLMTLNLAQPSHGMFRCKQDDEQRGCLSRIRKNIRGLSPRKALIAGLTAAGAACIVLTRVMLVSEQTKKEPFYFQNYRLVDDQAYSVATSSGDNFFLGFQPKLTHHIWHSCVVGEEAWYNKFCDW